MNNLYDVTIFIVRADALSAWKGNAGTISNKNFLNVNQIYLEVFLEVWWWI